MTTGGPPSGGGSPGGGKRAAVIVNPTKFDRPGRVREQVRRVCSSHGWAEPLWLETTADDPGVGQCRQAIEAGVDLICALGGDGTVRTVGAELAGSQTPMGLLPGGTGNLLARNLDLPVESRKKALEIALTGKDTAIDTCQLDLIRPVAHGDGSAGTGGGAGDADAGKDTGSGTVADGDPHSASDAASHEGGKAKGSDLRQGERERHTFLVMAGMGFDAQVMAGASEQLKARVGWAAYVMTGMHHLKGPQFTIGVKVGSGSTHRRRVRSVMIGNVGELQGGLEIFPGARADDGELYAALLSPEGMVGWAATFTQLVTRTKFGHKQVDQVQSQEVRVVADQAVELQLDGDTMGKVRAIRVRVQPGNLVVRTRR